MFFSLIGLFLATISISRSAILPPQDINLLNNDTLSMISAQEVISPLNTVNILDDADALDDVSPLNSEDFVQEYTCANCSAVRISRKDLNGTYKKIAEFQCDKDHPYCDKKSGSCTKETDDVACKPVSLSFYCPADGYYPDPLDCKKYHVCVKGVAYIGDCGTSFYNVKSENCHYTYTCNTISCTGKTGIKVAYENDKSFFGYCYNGSLIMFDKCPGKFKLDAEKQTCLPTCTQEGYQGDPNDYRKYYKCSYELSATVFTLAHLQCPENEVFDSLNSRCVLQQERPKYISKRV